MLRVDSRCVRFAQHLRLFPKSDSLDVVDFNRDPKKNHFAITASANKCRQIRASISRLGCEATYDLINCYSVSIVLMPIIVFDY